MLLRHTIHVVRNFLLNLFTDDTNRYRETKSRVMENNTYSHFAFYLVYDRYNGSLFRN